MMPKIRSVSDLRNHSAEISRTVHETGEPVILTKNGYGDMVVMSYKEYQNIQNDMMIIHELLTAELESETATERIAHNEVVSDIRGRIKALSRSHI